jgi:hypothetical protein
VFLCVTPPPSRYLNRHADVNSSCFDVPKIYGKFPARVLLAGTQRALFIDSKTKAAAAAY